jgi:hypothetical protein
MATLYTVGHGARSAGELICLLRNPQFTREPLSAALEEAGIGYDAASAIASYIAQWLVGRGHRVVHLLAAGRSREHVLHPQEELWRED